MNHLSYSKNDNCQLYQCAGLPRWK